MTRPSHSMTSHVQQELAPNSALDQAPPTRPTPQDRREQCWSPGEADRPRPLPSQRLSLYPSRLGRVGAPRNDVTLDATATGTEVGRDWAAAKLPEGLPVVVRRLIALGCQITLEDGGVRVDLSPGAGTAEVRDSLISQAQALEPLARALATFGPVDVIELRAAGSWHMAAADPKTVAPHPTPTWTCPWCRGTDAWTSRWHRSVCRRCHPPATSGAENVAEA
jgi:hypothetical protein